MNKCKILLTNGTILDIEYIKMEWTDDNKFINFFSEYKSKQIIATFIASNIVAVITDYSKVRIQNSFE